MQFFHQLRARRSSDGTQKLSTPCLSSWHVARAEHRVYRDRELREHGRGERVTGTGEGDLAIQAVARLTVALDEVRDEIHKPRLRDACRRVAGKLRSPVGIARR